MEVITCKNQVVILYEFKKGMPFCGFDFWLSFGAANDPVGLRGIAHLIEHLLGSAFTGYDLYSDHMMSASTSKDRVRVGTYVNVNHALDLICIWLKKLFSFNAYNYDFEYQKQKVLYEIQYLKKSPIIEAIDIVNEKSLKKHNYHYSTFGSSIDVQKLDPIIVNEYFKTKCKDGLVISIVGSINIENLIKFIELNIPKLKKIRKIIPSPLIQGQFIGKGHPGIMHVYDLKYIKDYAKQFCIAEYINNTLIDFPIRAKIVNYQKSRFLGVYIPSNVICIKKFEDWLNTPCTDMQVVQIRNYLFDYFNDLNFQTQKLAKFLQECFWLSYDVNIEHYINSMKELDKNNLDLIRTNFLSYPLIEVKLID